MPYRALASLSFALASLALSAPAQDDKLPPVDTVTKADPEAMKALDVVAFAPFQIGAIRTEDVDRVLGEGRIAWIETPHFCIGSTLKTCKWPDDSVARKEMQVETARMNKRYAKVKKRPKEFDAWLRLHLFAQRAEEIYADLADMLGQPDGKLPEGPYLGMKNKFVLMLFEKKSDLSRYADRFLGRQVDSSMRHYDDAGRQMAVLVTAESDPPYDDAAVHGTMRYLVARAMLEGLHGRIYDMPDWLACGLAHHYDRTVTTRVVNVHIADNEAIDRDSQHEWEDKIAARAKHASLLIPFTELAGLEELSYYPTLQSWTRAEFLLQRDRQKFGAFLVACVKKPKPESQIQALDELFELTAEAFDEEWRAWVLKAYK
ncbi:MAG: hypothetical protein AB7O97_21005 [Planctomycetota bacterium]